MAARGDLALRRLRPVDDDLMLLVRWRSAPHVRPWWDPDPPPLDLEGARAEYLPDTEPGSTTTLCITSDRKRGLALSPGGEIRVEPGEGEGRGGCEKAVAREAVPRPKRELGACPRSRRS